MPAEDRAREAGAQPPAPGSVSMRDLLASCAAADAVSKPPSEAEAPSSEAGRPRAAEEEAGPAAVPGAASDHPGRDAA